MPKGEQRSNREKKKPKKPKSAGAEPPPATLWGKLEPQLKPREGKKSR